MNKTIDAKFFILAPNEEDRIRINKLVEDELCEMYILDNHEIIIPLLSQLDKCILVIDRNTASQMSGFPESMLIDIIQACGEALISIIIVGTPENLPEHEKIYSYRESYLKNNQNILNIIDDLNIWGHRHYIRFGNKESRIAFFRMKFAGNWRTGVIHDISASGMSCSFDKYYDIEIDEHTTAIELCIKDKIFHLTGSFLIRRTFKNSNMFVLIFSRKRSNDNIQSLNSIIYHLTRDHILELIGKLV